MYLYVYGFVYKKRKGGEVRGEPNLKVRPDLIEATPDSGQ
jgi:hypothetical protein